MSHDDSIIPDPTPFERIISWVKILFATRKVLMLVWAFFFGVAGVAVKGNIDEVNPWKEAAIEVGLIDADPIEQEATDDAVLDEVLNLQAAMVNLEGKLEAMGNHTHEAVFVPHSHDLQEHEHPPPDLAHEHTGYALKSHAHDAGRVVLSSEITSIMEEAVKEVFDKEMEIHIDDVH